MNLSMTGDLAAAYRSGAQRARVVTEAWGEKNLFCPNCSSPKLTWLEPGHPASDYACPQCGFWYQLKSQKSRITDTITDGAYDAMIQAIRNDEAPSYFFLHYEIMKSPSPPRSGGEGRGEVARIKTPRPDPLPAGRGEGMLWFVRNLLLVPSFAFPPSAIIKRKPLSATARRAGWVGCTFDLSRIPADARIQVVRTITTSSPPSWTGERIRGEVVQLKSPHTGSLPAQQRGERVIVVPPAEVRARFQRVKPLQAIGIKERGWTLDVLNAVRRLVDSRRRGDESGSGTGKGTRLLTSAPTEDFTTADVYAFAKELEKLHPDNRHVRDKIRQQLQILRDAGLLIHIDRGNWRLP